MWVIATLRARLGIAAWPDTRVDRIPSRLARQWIRRHQPLEGRQVHRAGIERVVDAPPAPLRAGRQTQMGGRFDRWHRQQRIEQFKQGVASAPKQRVQLMAKGSQRFQFWRGHNQKDELASLSLSTAPSPTLSC